MIGGAHAGPLWCWQRFPLTWVGIYRYELCNFLLYCTRILGPHLYMSALLFLHGIHVGVPGPTAHSHYLELLIYKVFHTAGSIPAAYVLVAELSVFTYSETRPLAIHSTGLGASPLQEGKPAHRPRCWAPPCRCQNREKQVGVCCEFRSPASQPSGQAKPGGLQEAEPPVTPGRVPLLVPCS